MDSSVVALLDGYMFVIAYICMHVVCVRLYLFCVLFALLVIPSSDRREMINSFAQTSCFAFIASSRRIFLYVLVYINGVHVGA